MRWSYLLAVLIAVGAGTWVMTGDAGKQLIKGETKQRPVGTSVADRMAVPASDREQRLTAVRVRTFKAAAHVRAIIVRGRTEAKRMSTVKAGISGRVARINVKEGDRVKKGQILVRLQLFDRKAQLAEGEALARQRQLEYTAAKKLGQRGFRSETQIAGSAAQLDAAKAYVEQITVSIAKTVIRAPFDGVIDKRSVEFDDYVEAKTEMLTLIDEDPFLVVAHVSEADVGSLTVGGRGRANLVTGQKVTGKVRFISKIADPETRTFRVELEVANKDRSLRDGLSAELYFPIETLRAHLMSPALLTLNDKGALGLRTVDKAGKVTFYPARIAASGIDGVWLSGLPETVNVITVGNEFVRHGDKVRIVYETTETVETK